MDGGTSISRRTRSCEAAYFRNLHATKQKPNRRASDTDGGFTTTKIIESETEIESDDNDVITTSDDSDVEEEKKKRRRYVFKKKGPAKVGRPAKKRARGTTERDSKRGGGCTMKKIIESETEIESDVDDVITTSDDSDVEEEEKKRRRYVFKKKGSVKVGKKRASGMTEIEFDSLLVCKKDLVRESPVCVDVRECALPTKFKFEDDDEKREKKSEFEMEIERLFDDLELGLWESESGETPTPDSCVTPDEGSCHETSPEGRCRHDHILDEQIGVKCRFCHDLELEIKYVIPPFVTPVSERKKLQEPKNDDHHIQFNNGSNSECYKIPSKGEGTVFDLIPISDKELYPHQLEALEVIWRNIAGDTNIKNLGSLPSEGGQGSIISHSPGSGKTRLAIVFLQTFMRLYPGCRPMIMAPRGMLLTWEQELKKWDSGLDFHNLNNHKLSDQENKVADESGRLKGKDHTRFIKLRCWIKGGSILGVGYNLFMRLTQEHPNKKDGCFKKVLLEAPSLLVLDEGHTPRNGKSLVWKALTQVATKRRIILSGTPFQNNLDELHNTLSLVNPNLAKFTPRNSTASDDEIKKLRSKIQPFVHTHQATLTLPGIRHCLIILKPTDLQQELLSLVESPSQTFLEQDYLASLISLHPSLVSEMGGFENQRMKLSSLQLRPNVGVKTQLIVQLIHLSSHLHEKVLIFSKFLDPLRHLVKLLESHFKWSEGKEVMYIDGELSMEERQRVITSFNDRNSNAKVMLASLKACCEGISLVGASRVVLVDVSWNPSVQRQAICRAYRLGQQKKVYVYHLVTLMEIKKYAAQAEKDRISNLIFSTAVNKGERDDDVCEEDKVLEAMVDHQGSSSLIERIIHQPNETDFMKDFGLF